VTGTDGLGSLRTTALRSDDERTPVPPWLADTGDEEVLYVALHVHGSVMVRHDESEVFLEPCKSSLGAVSRIMCGARS
jgi:hypothetical protein